MLRNCSPFELLKLRSENIAFHSTQALDAANLTNATERLSRFADRPLMAAFDPCRHERVAQLFVGSANSFADAPVSLGKARRADCFARRAPLSTLTRSRIGLAVAVAKVIAAERLPLDVPGI